MGKIFAIVTGFFVLGVMTMMIILMSTSCTYSINMVDTHGAADDVVDETETVDPEFNPTLSLPGAL